MLEKLATIEWSKLRHALGEASDVPGDLRATLSQDAQEREQAFFDLFSTIYHQGKVYEASAYAVPFLFEILESDETPDKATVASLLAALADGHSYLEAHGSIDWLRPIIEKQLAADGREWQDELERERSWVRASRIAVGQRLEALYDYLQDPDEELRRLIISALALYPHRANETIPLLEQALETECNDDLREAIRAAVAQLRTGSNR